LIDIKAIPKIIVIEGINGCGKTTFIHELQTLMDKENIPNVIEVMVNPGPLRDEVLNNQDLSPIQRMLLLRVMSLTVQKTIRRHLAENKWVLLDRGWVSYQVYQGICHNLSHQQRLLEGILVDPFPKADFTVFLDPGLAVTYQRMAGRAGEEGDFFEKISADFDMMAEAGFKNIINTTMAENSWRSNYITFFDDIPAGVMAHMAWDQIKQVVIDDFEDAQ